MRERNTARNEGVLRTINGFESMPIWLTFCLPTCTMGGTIYAVSDAR